MLRAVLCGPRDVRFDGGQDETDGHYDRGISL